MAVDLARFFDVLANPSRLRVVGLLALEERTVEELAGLLDLKAAVVSRHLARLRDLGLVRATRERRRLRYSLDFDVLNEWTVARAPHRRRRSEGEAMSADEEERRILSDFVVDGRLTTLPARRAKRLVVLGWLAGLFRPGERYPEAQVNEVLQRYHDDTASCDEQWSMKSSCSGGQESTGGPARSPFRTEAGRRLPPRSHRQLGG